MKCIPYSILVIFDNDVLSLCNSDSGISKAVFTGNFLIFHLVRMSYFWKYRVFSLLVGYLISIYMFVDIFFIKICFHIFHDIFLMIRLFVLSGIQSINSYFSDIVCILKNWQNFNENQEFFGF